MLGSGVTNAQTVFAVNMIRDLSNDNGGFWGREGQDSGLRIGNTTWYWPATTTTSTTAAPAGSSPSTASSPTVW
jgi:hypothetical protein